jgi:hypothetical protein
MQYVLSSAAPWLAVPLRAVGVMITVVVMMMMMMMMMMMRIRMMHVSLSHLGQVCLTRQPG